MDPSSLGAFRIWFGVCMLVEVIRYFRHGWISRYYVEPVFHFTYPGFDFVRPWLGSGMYLHFLVLGIAATAIALGLFYRAAAVVMFFGFTYVFLLEEANYLNHFYLISLLAFLLMWMPANRWAALDLLRRRREPSDPPPTVPFWTVFLLRAQLAIVYLFSGMARVDADWLRGRPMERWVERSLDLPVLGPILGEPWAPILLSWGGMLFDLMVAPLLLWRRTRPIGLLWALCFHFLNLHLFQIGIFPWLAMGATLIFAAPDWPKRVGLRLGRWAGRSGRAPAMGPRAGGAVTSPSRSELSGAPIRWLTAAGIASYLLVQLLVPLRHWFYPGNVSWTEEGHLLSWHMKLRDKAGDLRCVTVTHPGTGEHVLHDPKADLTDRQYSKMVTRPRMVLKYVDWLADRYEKRWGARPEIRVDLWASLNDRPYQLLIDPEVDLARVVLRPGPSTWIVPLRAPLPRDDLEESRLHPRGRAPRPASARALGSGMG